MLASHGILFTNIQLDDFKRVLDRFQEKLQIGGKCHWLVSLPCLDRYPCRRRTG